MRIHAIGLGVLLGVLAGAGGAVTSAAGAGEPDEAAVRARVAPWLCRVTVQNAWDVPLAVAGGFILGNGRFVVTELGAVAQPGAARAVVCFHDGSEVTAEQFGMADPASGLAALYLKPGRRERQGAPVAQEALSVDGGIVVTAVGWDGRNEVGVASGRLGAGPRMAELAALTGASAPPAKWAFFRVGHREIAGAVGMPILGPDGTVVGVRMDVITRGKVAPLVVPSTALWDALFASTPQLKPITEVSQAAWPVPVLRLEGQLLSAPEFARAVQCIKDAVPCRPCASKGYTVEETLDAYSSYKRVPCKACAGEGIACVEGVYPLLAEMAVECTRLAWAPLLEARSRKAFLTAGLGTLASLASAGPRFQKDWSNAVEADWGKKSGPPPRGIVIHARVTRTVAGPDGQYVLLEESPSGVVVALRATAVGKPAEPGPDGTPAELKQGTWIVLGGVAQSRLGPNAAEGGPAWIGPKALCVLPFGWVPAGAPLGPPPTRRR